MNAVKNSSAGKSDEIKWLEKVYGAEVECRLPFQTKAAIMKRLAEQGLVQRMKIRVGTTFAATVEGWELTHAGRLMYCLWASEKHEKAARR